MFLFVFYSVLRLHAAIDEQPDDVDFMSESELFNI